MLLAAQGIDKSESSGQKRLERAKALHSQGKFKESLGLYNSILRGNPEKSQRLDAKKGLVEAQLETGAWDEAEQSYAELIRDHRRDNGTGVAIQQIGTVYARKGQRHKARACYQRVISEYGKEPGAVMWAHQSTALLALAEDNLPEANQHVQSILTRYKAEKDTPMSLERLARVYAGLGHKKEAMAMLQESLSLSQKKEDHCMQAWNYNAQALVHIMDGQYDQAQAKIDMLIQQCRGKKDWALALSYLANDSQHFGHPDQALLICEKVLKAYGDDPDTACLWNNLANAYIGTGQYDQASDAVNQLMRRWPDDPGMGHYLTDIALRWEQAECHDQACALFQRVRRFYSLPEGRTSPEVLDGLVAKSRALAALTSKNTGRTQAGVNALLSVHRRSAQGIARFLFEVGEACEKAGLASLAQDLFTEATAGNNPDASLEDRGYMAQSHLKLGQNTRAEMIMEEIYSSSAHDPRYGETVLELGLEYFEQAVHRDPQRPEETTRALQEKAHKWLTRYLQDCPFHEEWNPVARFRQAQTSLRLEQFSRARIELETWLKSYDGHALTGQVSLYLTRCYRQMMMAGQITPQETDLLSDRLHQGMVSQHPQSQEAKIAQRHLDRNKKEAVQ
jgi:tetratricopeptide (TPR) repeat protein